MSLTKVSYSMVNGAPINVLDFGADPTGAISSSTAIQAAADYCKANGKLLVAFEGTYLITTTVILYCACELTQATFIANAATVKPVIRVGPISGGSSSTDLVISQTIGLPKVINTAKTTTGWTAGWGSGIELAHVYESRIVVPWVEGFNVGLDCGGYDYGFSYNEIHLGRVYNNKIGVLVQPKEVPGWANENLFYSGRCTMDSAEGVVSDARYIKIAPFDVTNATTSWPNNNVFIKPSVENQGPAYAIEIAGAFNFFHNSRFEANLDVLMVGHTSSTKTYENQFMGGYQVSSIVITETGVVTYNGIWNSRGSTIDGSDVVVNLRNASSDTYPIFQTFDANTSPFGKTVASTNWCGRLTSQGYRGKKAADTNVKILLSHSGSEGRLYLGDGNTPTPTVWFSAAGSPETVYDAPVGSVYTRTDGGAGTTLYIKESGTAKTGWVAK